MISFIIPYHNEPLSMLRQCLDSVLSLSLSKDEREIIVVDDGSSHSPINDLRDIHDSIIYVRQKNGGLSRARNTGLKLASGEYVQFIDADDYLLRAPYEHCLDIMRYQEPDVVMFNQAQSNPKNVPTHYEGPIDGTRYMRHNNLHAAAWGYLFKRQLAGSLAFSTKTRSLRHSCCYVPNAYLSPTPMPIFTENARGRSHNGTTQRALPSG